MDYAHPEVLVETDWLEARLDDPSIRIAEVDVDTAAYGEGHIPGAFGWNWTIDLCNTLQRDIAPKGQLEALLGASGIGTDTTIVLYGDNNNWFACWAFWQLKIYGHDDVRILDGGRKKWVAEGRALTTDAATATPTTYTAAEADRSTRAFLREVEDLHTSPGWELVDVRSADEFAGRILAPPGLPETCQRGGHIPGAKNVGWGMNCNEDGTFKSYDELRALYDAAGVTANKNVVAYCRIGERSSLTWFAIKYLLGHRTVLNYDGSWTEWGNLVGAPVKTGDEP